MPLKTKLASLLTLRRGAQEATDGLPALTVEAEVLARGLLSGVHVRRKAGSGEKFWQFRAYDPADRPQDIDWRLSAKGDRIHVREKERQASRTLYLSVDPGPRMAYASRRTLPAKAHVAGILALGTALVATRGGEQVTLTGSGLRAGRGENVLQTMALALSGEGMAPPFLPPESVPSGGYLVAVGDFLDSPEEVCARIEASGAAPGGVLAIQVLDPAEMDLPFEGRAIFEDPADGRGRSVLNVAGVREEYRRRLGAHIESIGDLCRHRHWHLLLHRTDTPPRETLHKVWATVGPGLARAGGPRA